jgi:hypothetical protein
MNRICGRLFPLLPLLVLVVALGACATSETTTPCPEVECPECPEVDCPECPAAECPDCPECPEPVVSEVPFQDLWASSGHADETAEAFRHWDEDDPAEVSASCAKCHSAPGYKDFLGIDGTAAGVVDNAASIDTVIDCTVCHNEGTATMTSVMFPSGAEITGLGDESRCMHCHQGRASTVSVNDAVAAAGVDDDATSEDLGFVNIHYYAAAATQYGTFAMGGYQYDGKSYDARFAHVEEFDQCFECHDPHSLELRVGSCSECHPDVSTAEDVANIRLPGSTADYDGDGDVDEGVTMEIEGLQGILYAAMQDYASDVPGTAIAYDSHAYPYFFIDTNEDGEADEDEANYGNQYNAWTPRLVKAAYNYQVSFKDPGSYAHGGKYIIQLLYDSIEDLDPDRVAGLNRIDAGHFAGSEEAWRHWDEDGAVPGSCGKCHTASGLPFFLEEGVNVSGPPANGMQCTTCHDTDAEFAVYPVETVTFPSGANLTLDKPASNICLHCHQGRESTLSVNAAIGELEPDAVAEQLRFLNVHYFAAGATLFGTEAQGAYEYADQVYVGPSAHPEDFNDCIECHSPHGLELDVQLCGVCHDGVRSAEDLTSIRTSRPDYDGDGNVDEGIHEEITTLLEVLYEAVQAYAAEIVDTPIAYDAHAYPYFFVDSNANGETDADEANYGNRFTAWTPRLLRAAYNYQYASKDPGAYAHNPIYMIQVLHDALADMGAQVPVEMTGMVRP